MSAFLTNTNTFGRIVSPDIRFTGTTSTYNLFIPVDRVRVPMRVHAGLVNNNNNSSNNTNSNDLNALTIVMLKERLREEGLPVSGKKAKLVERLCSVTKSTTKSTARIHTSQPKTSSSSSFFTNKPSKGYTNKEAAAQKMEKGQSRFQQQQQSPSPLKQFQTKPNPTKHNVLAAAAVGVANTTPKSMKRKRNPGKRERMAKRKWTCTTKKNNNSNIPDQEKEHENEISEQQRNERNNIIEALLTKRDKARQTRDFGIADDMLDDLWTEHGVYLDDTTRTYEYRVSYSASTKNANEVSSVSRTSDTDNNDDDDPRKKSPPPPSSSPATAAWTRRGGAKQPLSETELTSILDQIRQRDGMRRRGDFQSADEFRTDLAQIHGVRLDDNSRMWWTNAPASMESSSSGGSISSSNINMNIGSGSSGGWKCANDDDPKEFLRISSTEEDQDTDTKNSQESDKIQEILTMVKERDVARKSQNYRRADTIREELMEDYGVHLDDDLKMWWVSPPDGSFPNAYLQAKTGTASGSITRWDSTWKCVAHTDGEMNRANIDTIMPQQDKVAVQGMLMAREDARRKRNYAAADKIRDDLRRMHNVHLDDVNHTWSVWTGEESIFPRNNHRKEKEEWSSFDAEPSTYRPK